MYFVSGFVTGVNVRDDRTIDKYVDLGKHLLQVGGLDIVLFLEKSVAQRMVPEMDYSSAETFSYGGKTFSYIRHWGDVGGTFRVSYLVLFEKEDMYFWNYRFLCSSFAVETTNSGKDSLDYFLVQIQKLEWMRIAIRLLLLCGNNPGHETNGLPLVGWIDFGIAHVFRGDTERFRRDMSEIIDTNNGMVRGQGRVRFASCREWKPDNPVVWALDIYTHVKWVMAGGVFVGWPEDIERLAGVFYERCFRILIERRTLMWEVNVLALLWLERRDLFELFPCNHDSSIVQTYGKPIPEDWICLGKM